MSLEASIKELTEAVNRNNELLEFMTSAARKGINEKSTATTDAAPSEKATDTEAAPKRTRRKAAPKAPSTKDMAEATTKFLDVDDEEEYKARRELVKKIVDRLGAKKMSEIEEGDRQGALDMLEAFKNGDDPFAGDDEGEGDDDLA